MTKYYGGREQKVIIVYRDATYDGLIELVGCHIYIGHGQNTIHIPMKQKDALNKINFKTENDVVLYVILPFCKNINLVILLMVTSTSKRSFSSLSYLIYSG